MFCSSVQGKTKNEVWLVCVPSLWYCFKDDWIPQFYFDYKGIFFLVSATNLGNILNFCFGKLLGPGLFSVHRREADSSKTMTFIDCSREDTKYKILRFINRYPDILIGRNALSVGIDSTKVVEGVWLSHTNKAIFGGSQHNLNDFCWGNDKILNVVTHQSHEVCGEEVGTFI